MLSPVGQAFEACGCLVNNVIWTSKRTLTLKIWSQVTSALGHPQFISTCSQSNPNQRKSIQHPLLTSFRKPEPLSTTCVIIPRITWTCTTYSQNILSGGAPQKGIHMPVALVVAKAHQYAPPRSLCDSIHTADTTLLVCPGNYDGPSRID